MVAHGAGDTGAVGGGVSDLEGFHDGGQSLLRIVMGHAVTNRAESAGIDLLHLLAGKYTHVPLAELEQVHYRLTDQWIHPLAGWMSGYGSLQ